MTDGIIYDYEKWIEYLKETEPYHDQKISYNLEFLKYAKRAKGYMLCPHARLGSDTFIVAKSRYIPNFTDLDDLTKYNLPNMYIYMLYETQLISNDGEKAGLTYVIRYAEA